MNRFQKFLLFLVLALVVDLAVWFIVPTSYNATFDFKLNLTTDKNLNFQIFYENTVEFSEEKSFKYEIKADAETTITASLPVNIKNIRLDFGQESSNVKINKICFELYNKKIIIELSELSKANGNDIKSLLLYNGELFVETDGTDPYVIFPIEHYNLDTLSYTAAEQQFRIKKILICLFIDLFLFIFLRNFQKIMALPRELWKNKRLILILAKNDFKTKYAGSYLGIIWAFVQPIVTIIVYWLVFEFGLRAGSPIEGVPFVLWFTAGLIPWFFFQEALLNATNCMVEYSYLVKKVVFRVSILPIVKVISSLLIHLIFVSFLFVVGGIYGFYPNEYIIQLLYYVFCTFCLALAISYITSAIVVFIKDLGQVINIFLQIGMWATPIMWSVTIIDDKYQWIVKLNPMYYITEGYRDVFINHVWFYLKSFQTIYFWSIVLVLFLLGFIIFRKLRPHFADVL